MGRLTRGVRQDKVGTHGRSTAPTNMSGLPANSELTSAIVREPAGVRLLLRGELDMNGVLETERAVAATAELVPEGRLTIDLAELEFMDLFGARVLLRSADAALTPTRVVVIANPKGHVRRLFELITDLAWGRSLVTELVRPVG
jgi:anti-sigma B factor antagonist